MRFACLAGVGALAPVLAHAAPPGYVQLLRGHFDRVIEAGADVYGEDHSELWLASIDIRRGGQSEEPYPAVLRTYRKTHAPRGSNLYWDQPAVVAAHHLNRLTGDTRYRDAAERYVRDFLERCVSPDNGRGNYLYRDVLTDQVVAFSGGHFEARPLPCAWDLFWAASPERTERCIRSMGVQHVRDPRTGLFDRHASIHATEPPAIGDRAAHPFLESGGVLVESLAWLSARTGHADPWPRERALLVARFSFGQKGEKTGLIRNQPGPLKRWDYHTATTEVGMWAGCLLRAAGYTGVQEFRDMARDAVIPYLRYGYDPETRRYFGRLLVKAGSPRQPKRGAGSGEETVCQPGEYADLWEPLFPTHNYPMSMAEACLTLNAQTGDARFEEAVRRWAEMVALSMPANEGRGAYADQCGRCIAFLARASRVLRDAALLRQAGALAAQAVSHLFLPGLWSCRAGWACRPAWLPGASAAHKTQPVRPGSRPTRGSRVSGLQGGLSRGCHLPGRLPGPHGPARRYRLALHRRARSLFIAAGAWRRGCRAPGTCRRRGNQRPADTTPVSSGTATCERR